MPWGWLAQEGRAFTRPARFLVQVQDADDDADLSSEKPEPKHEEG